LELIDLAAAIEARRFNPRNRYVTVAMKEVRFHEPVEVGDIVSCYSVTERVGTTSITIKVDVISQRGRDLAECHVTEAEVTFVAVDAEGRPIPVRDDDSA